MWKRLAALGLLLAVGSGGTPGRAQDASQPCDAIRTGEVVTVDLDTCEVPPLPPAAGCGLAGAAFCETFEGPRNTVGNRNGDWPITFSAARWKSEGGDSRPNHVDPGGIPTCRPGQDSTPLPPGDSLVCDPNASHPSRYGLTSTAEQNYGDNSYRINRPFDIAGRTGTISLDLQLGGATLLSGFPVVSFIEKPMVAPSYQSDNSAGPTPERGVHIQFAGLCFAEGQWSPSVIVYTYNAQRETKVDNQASCDQFVTSQPGRLNRVQIHLSQTRLDVWGTDVGGTLLQPMYGAPISLAFTRGYVSVGVHNHATVKYVGQPSWTGLFDNVAFDGPVVLASRVSQVADASTPSGGGVNLGYPLPTSGTGPLVLPGVDADGTSARLLFNLSVDFLSNRTYSDWRVNYRFNGGTWHTVALGPDELALAPMRAGSYSFTIPVALSELHDGTNTVELSGAGFYIGTQPFVANLEVVTQ